MLNEILSNAEVIVLPSSATIVLTQVIKEFLDQKDYKYSSNAIALLSSLLIATFYSVGSAILDGTYITQTLFENAIGLTLIGWLSAMYGYDKFVQTIRQIRKLIKTDKEEE